MNTDFAILVAPMGCFSQSRGSASFQHETQSYVKDHRPFDQLHERKRLVRAILSVRRFTPEIDQLIRAHLRAFDLRSVWDKLSKDRRTAVSEELFGRIQAVAAGRVNGTASFDLLLCAAQHE